MLKPRLQAALAAAVTATLTSAAAQAATLPLLSGPYLYTRQKLCQMPITVVYGGSPNVPNTPFVTFVGPTGSTPSSDVSAGKVSFTQGTTAGTGTAKINGLEISGTPLLITATGSGISGGGTSGTPMAASADIGTASFTQTATQLTLTSGGSESFNIYYGKLAAGIAQSAVFVGLDSDGCGEVYSLTRN